MSGPKRTIGVLGGMGPEATVLFMQKMMAAVDARDDAAHVPLIVDNNTQVPSRIKAIIEGGGEDPGPILATMARRLQQAGAEALAMPCNTAHYYAPQIEAASDVPFIDMVQLSAAKAYALTGDDARIGILGSPALQLAGVLEAPFGANGVTPLYSQEHDEMLAIIRSVKADGMTDPTRQRLQSAVDHLLSRGADAIMVCCTEYSLAAGQLHSEKPVFDGIDELVAACVGFSVEERDQDKSSSSTVAARRSSTASVYKFNDQEGKEAAQC